MIRMTSLFELPAVGGSPIKGKSSIVEDNHMMDDEGVYDDHEAPMAKAQLMNIHKQSAELFNMIAEDEELEGWVQHKLSLAADYINAVHSNMQYEKSNATSLGSGMGTPADVPLMEKWEGDAKIKSTGEHAGKTIEQLKKELSALKAKSKKYQDKGEKVPTSIIDQEREVIFAIRAKKGWPTGKDSI